MQKDFLIIGLLLACIVVLLTACQSLSHDGKFQEISVTTKPERASCLLQNDKSKREVYTPAVVQIARSRGDLIVSCFTPSQKGAKAYKANLNGTYDAIVEVPIK